MDGIFLIDKPSGMTSRDVVNKLMRKFNTKKVGHTGTLDPFARGLLIVCVNKATKIANYIESLNKEYIAELKLGVSTSTLDLEGQIIETKKVTMPLNFKLVEDVLKSFVGEIKQIPPMYSAIKIGGEELYKKARRGEVVERKSRNVKIEQIDLIKIDNDILTFKVKCSKGTYIRSLGEDIAKKLNYPGHLIKLTRTKVGNFSLEEAKSLEEINENDAINIFDALNHMDKVIVDGKDELKVKNGVKMKLFGNETILIVSKTNVPLAIYQKKEDGFYHCLRGLL